MLPWVSRSTVVQRAKIKSTFRWINNVKCYAMNLPNEILTLQEFKTCTWKAQCKTMMTRSDVISCLITVPIQFRLIENAFLFPTCYAVLPGLYIVLILVILQVTRRLIGIQTKCNSDYIENNFKISPHGYDSVPFFLLIYSKSSTVVKFILCLIYLIYMYILYGRERANMYHGNADCAWKRMRLKNNCPWF